jgi:hypothetical protein
MPRPGYEHEDDSHLDRDDLLNRFDPDARAELAARLEDKSIGEAHVAQLYKLFTTCPEERDSDTVAEILDATAGMGAEEFAKWIDERISRWKDR